MSSRTIKILFAATVLLLTLVAFLPTGPKEQTKDEILSEIIKLSLKNYHYSTIEFNDEFSEKAFDLYLERLDYNKRFFLVDDYEKLSEYKYKIDDELNTNSFELYNQANSIFEKRIEESKSYFEDLIEQPFNYNKKENLESDPEKIAFASGKKEIKDRWRQYLKFQTLDKINDIETDLQKLKENPDTSVADRPFAEIEEEARGKVKKSLEEYFKRLSKINEKDQFSTYVNSITAVFDPHTNYFPPADKENFDISMSGKLEGIGATLQEKDGFITVVKIVPGSASWSQGELKPGHIITKVGQANEEPVSIVDMRLDEAVQLIRGKKDTEVKLTIKNHDGRTKVISIIRDIVVLEETYAKSIVVFDSTKANKFGYIYLPKFYRDFNDAKGRSCAEDVKIEIEKLKKENVKGIILDLRNNGGGSLNDVVDMGGLFIEKGPIVQVKPRDGSPYILEDKDPAVNYNGPLLIMVNEFSASASEILAAAMQDYNRAIIMGSKATYGKGTVQRFIDLDAFLSGSFKSFSPMGSMKLTIQKFYRINGGATQIKGVMSDIVVPDEYMYLDLGENEQEYPLPWDKIDAVEYKKATGYIEKLPVLIQKSKMRVQHDSIYQRVNQRAKFIKESRDNTTIPLDYDEYTLYQQALRDSSTKYENIEAKAFELKFVVPSEDQILIEQDSTKATRMENWQKELRKDHTLLEAVHILNDIY